MVKEQDFEAKKFKGTCSLIIQVEIGDFDPFAFLHSKCLQGITGTLQGKSAISTHKNPIIIVGFPCKSVNITGFLHNIHNLSL